MSWDGNGVVALTNGRFTGENIFGRIADAADENVRADRFDALVADLKETLELCLTRDGQNALLGALDMGGNRVRNLAQASAQSDAVRLSQLTEGLARGNYVQASQVGGTANAITLTPDPAVAAHVTGASYRFVAKGDNSGNMTLEVSGLASVALRKRSPTGALVELAAGDVRAGAELFVSHDGAQFVVLAGLRPAERGLDRVTAGGGAALTGVWRGTRDQYDALGAKDPNVVYFVEG